MFTQFFGSYLLNQKLVSPSQLIQALESQKEVRLKLGLLAINQNFMTAQQVNMIHEQQQSTDKKFGEIAKDMGYLTDEQVTQLLCEQPTGHLLLGQTLVNMGIMTNDDFENALNSYKRLNGITDVDFTNAQKKKVETVIKNFYHFDNDDNSTYYMNYISLLFKNIIRFVGNDFTPMEIKKISCQSVAWATTQNIYGKFNLFTAIDCNEQTMIEFARRYSNEPIAVNDEFTQDCMNEFLNLQNGLFSVNMSNNYQIELKLDSPSLVEGQDFVYDKDIYCIPICFSFGTVFILLSETKPKIV